MCASPARKCAAPATTANCRAGNILKHRRLPRPAWLYPATQNRAFERMIAGLNESAMHARLRDFPESQLRHHFEQAGAIRQEPGNVVFVWIVSANVAHGGRFLRTVRAYQRKD